MSKVRQKLDKEYLKKKYKLFCEVIIRSSGY